MKALRKSLDRVADVTREQQSRVQEAVQGALRDGSLEWEFRIKEKNRMILTLEEDKRALKQECSSRESALAILHKRLENEQAALVAMQNGARKQIKEMAEQRQALQQKLMAYELGMPSDSPHAPGLREALGRYQQEASQQRSLAESLQQQLAAVQASAAEAQRAQASREAEWDAAKQRAVGQLRVLQADKVALQAEAEAARQQASEAAAQLSARAADADAFRSERDALRRRLLDVEAAGRATAGPSSATN